MKLSVAGGSHAGSVRPNNEDAWAADDLVAVVCDGVGGRPAGEVASAIAARFIHAAIRAGVDAADAIQGASDTVRDVAAANSLFTGMCCTATVAVATPAGVTIAHVGDSKAWIVRGGNAVQVTEDQTITARMVREGELSPEEAAVHPKRATLYQVVGSIKPLEVEVHHLELDLDEGARVVLGTDGLDYADGSKLAEILASPGSPAEVVDALVDAALEGGGHDNVTVVVADVVEGDATR